MEEKQKEKKKKNLFLDIAKAQSKTIKIPRTVSRKTKAK